jgi:ketosteroid isomerase-like protein
MSQENVEIAKQMYAAFNRGDFDGFFERCSPDFEFQDLPELPGSSVFVGHDAFHAWWAQMLESFDDLRFDAHDFIDAGERVVAVNHATGRGKGSGAIVEMRMSNVWTLSEGKVVSLVTYRDHSEALEAAGLRE